MFTATLHPEPFFARLKLYVSAVNSALRKVAPIKIEFRGVTASPSTVMIQGFFENDALNDMRDALRDQLRIQHLGDGLDRRYRLETAHMTVARFRAPLRYGERLARTLEEARQRPFGSMRIRSLSLVKNDWYMSHQAVEIVKRYSILHRGHPVEQH
jgi:2'-5' RNA ligase